MMEDKRLIWQCRRGSRDALRRIYEKYHVDLLKLAVVLTGESSAAQDVVHDVFVKFAQSVRFQQWENAVWEGPATLVGDKITFYESLPDDLFEFQIPPGATVQEQ